MLLTDPQVLAAIGQYREEHQERHGPLSLSHLRAYCQKIYGTTITKSAFHMRIKRLVEHGYLLVTEDWHCGFCNSININKDATQCKNCGVVQEKVTLRRHTSSLALSESAKELVNSGVLEEA